MPSIPTFPSPWQQGVYDDSPATQTLQQRVNQIAEALMPPCWQALADAAMRPLRAAGPYVPASADEERIAQWLASPSVWLLESMRGRYSAAYRLTFLGVAVVHAFLTEYLYGRTASATPTVPSTR